MPPGDTFLRWDAAAWPRLRQHAVTDAEWALEVVRLPVGAVIEGTVVAHARFGVFLDLGGPVQGLVRIADLGVRSPDDYPKIGSVVSGIVIDHTEHNRQVVLSCRHVEPRSSDA